MTEYSTYCLTQMDVTEFARDHLEIEISEQMAHDFLSDHEDELLHAMIGAGWDFIEAHFPAWLEQRKS